MGTGAPWAAETNVHRVSPVEVTMARSEPSVTAATSTSSSSSGTRVGLPTIAAEAETMVAVGVLVVLWVQRMDPPGPTSLIDRSVARTVEPSRSKQ
jgi:hypothetical protein